MRSFINILFIAVLHFWAGSAFAQQTAVNSLKHQVSSDHSRLIFDLSAKFSHKVFQLDNPPRLVIDIRDARLKGKLDQPSSNHPLFKKIRSAVRNDKDLRVVVDLKKNGVAKNLTTPANQSSGYQLMIDFFAKQDGLAAKPPVTLSVASHPLVSKRNASPNPAKRPSVRSEALAVAHNKPVKKAPQRSKDVVIAIDAGHGGQDPGAKGPHGTHEKNVTFAIAKKLAALIDRKSGMRAVMVRQGDYYIDLKKRMKIARESKADLFVSIHADAYDNPSVKGASVFTLSNKGATTEMARWLANHENSADLVGGVSLVDKDDVLASVLLDLSMTATQEASQNAATKVLGSLKQVGHLHSRSVQKAGFLVLKSPDVPAILVETAFISNPDEESKLRSVAHQNKMARAIFNGIDSYFQQAAPAGTYIAEQGRQHVISRGETLSGIAQQYGISMQKIKTTNAMNGNQVRIGQVLSIPVDG
ncbi:MAG: N-acetylmuramoyl-L-alanine amidase [Methylomicrobium sp.]|nr:N-acetylmuramoyl-L-alanine amidase [Methylomicrobium sp.]